MARYYLSKQEVWPELDLTKEYDPNDPDAYEIPDELVDELRRANKAVLSAEDAILKHAGFDPEDWRLE